MTFRFKTGTASAYETISENKSFSNGVVSYDATIGSNADSFSINHIAKWNTIKDVFVQSLDTHSQSLTISNFVYANVDYSLASTAFVDIDNAKRASVTTGSGADIINISVVNSPDLGGAAAGDINSQKNSVFTVNSGAGDDKITFDIGVATPGVNVANSSGTHTFINSGDGDDTIDMGSGGKLQTIDVIDAGAGNDIVHAGGGADIVQGGDGDDKLFGESGNDILRGGTGKDYVDGGSGNDFVYGGAGDDTLFGRAGNDTLVGDDGNDKISGGSGKDILTGGAGADRFVIGANDLVLDDSAPAGSKVGIVDTITDFNFAEGDRIDVQKPADWIAREQDGGTFLTNSHLLAGSGIFLQNVTGFTDDWLV